MRKLLDSFTATHVTVLLVAALMVPSALYGVPAYTNVALEDPQSGARALIDANRRMSIHDPVAGYTSNPMYAVNITDSTTVSAGYHAIYTVPGGKVLLIKSLSWADYSNTEGNNSFYYLYNASATNIYNTEGLHVANSSTATFEPGLVVRAGALNALYSGTSGSNAYIQGYLIPADAVPAASTAAAEQQFVTLGRPGTPRRPQ